MHSFEDNEIEEASFHQNVHCVSQRMPKLSNFIESNSTIPADEGLQTMDQQLVVSEKEHTQADIPNPPSAD